MGEGKNPVCPKYCLFMLLTVMKNCEKWDFLAIIFNCKGPTFERLIIHIVSVASLLLYKAMVRLVEKSFLFYSMLKGNKNFRTFQAA